MIDDYYRHTISKYSTDDLIRDLLKRKEVRVQVIYQGENHTISNTLMGHWILESSHELAFKKGERYYIQGWTWMRLINVKRTIHDSGVYVTYEFESDVE